jgi:2-keto-4-pentenoate hydratase/2-oxohepta-3-ene-1,7-dioic acid hydratase in catechol pathway
MEWSVNELLAYVEARTHFLCGDLLFTGTPAGVGLETGRYQQPGDVVEATIERFGTVHNTVHQGS